MPPRYIALLVGVGLAVPLAGVGSFIRIAPESNRLELIAAFVLAIVVMGGSIAFALWSSRRARVSRDRFVARVDEALRALAGRMSAQYLVGDSYQHPMVGTIKMAGRVRGTTAGASWHVRFSEGEDENDHEIEIVVTGVPMRNNKLTVKDPSLSPAARAMLQALIDEKHRAECSELVKDSPSGSSLSVWVASRAIREPDHF